MKTLLSAIVVAVLCATQLPATEPPDADALAAYERDGSYASRREFVEQLGNHRVRPDVAQRTLERLRALGTGRSSKAPLPAWEGMPTKGTNNILALLIEFPDYAHVNNRTLIESSLFGAGSPAGYPRESLRSFYLRSSYNQLKLQGNVLGWYQMQHPRDWYTTTYSDINAARRAIIEEAVRSFDDTHDFSQYDNDHDGEVDYLAVFWAGPDDGWGNFWWGYKSALSTPVIADGVRFKTFTWQWESKPVGSAFDPQVIIHETGHALGVPDYYDYNASIGPNGGVGGLDIMDNDRADHNSFSKFMLEWLTPTVVSSGQSNVTLRALAESPNALAIMPGYAGTNAYAEYFMVENRWRTNNDTGNPGDGVLIWHVDARPDASGQSFLYNNSYTEHKLLRLMEADGLERIETTLAMGADAGDYYNSGETLSPYSSPNSRTYSGANSDLTVSVISPDRLVMEVACSVVREAPAVFSQPQSRTVLAGATVAFTVTVHGSDPLTYQWRQNGVNLDGATNVTLYLPAVTPIHAGNYSVVASNSLGTATSVDATLTVSTLFLGHALDAPTLSWNTGGQAAWSAQTNGAWDAIDVAASGQIANSQESWIETVVSGPVAVDFWWRVSSETNHDFLCFFIDGVRQSDGLSGETPWQQCIFYLPGGTHTLRWRYAKDTSSSAGQDCGWVDLVSLLAPKPPTIATNPASQSSSAGNEVTFDVSATGTPFLAYQWSRSGAAIPGATNRTLRLTNVQTVQAGSYSVVVDNPAGTVVSANATLTVYDRQPNISPEPKSQTAALGSNVSLTVKVTGSEPFQFEWQKDGIALPGATNAAYTILNVQTNDAGRYRVVVQNDYGSDTSAEFSLWVPSVLNFRGQWPGFRRGVAEDVQVEGNYAFVGLWNGGLGVFDISDPAHPLRVGGYPSQGLVYSIHVTGGYAYVPEYNGAGLVILDVRNPALPVRVGSFETYRALRDVQVVWPYAYLTEDAGLLVINVSNPASPVLVGSLKTTKRPVGVQVIGPRAYVADRDAGVLIVDVSDPSNPTLLGSAATPDQALDVCVVRDLAYVACWDAGMCIFNVSDPTSPVPLGSYNTGGQSSGIKVVGRNAMVADLAGGLQIIDVFDPLHPQWVSGYNSTGAVAVDVIGSTAYVADIYAGLRILNVSNLTSPVFVGEFDLAGDASGVQVVQNYAYLADGDAGVRVINVSDPARPVSVSHTGVGDNAYDLTYDLCVVGQYAYVAAWYSGLRVFDLSNPSSPVRVGGVFTPGKAQGVVVAGDLACLAAGDAGLAVFRISDPAHPVLLGRFNTSGDAQAVDVARSYAYVADYGAGLQIIDLHNPTNPVRVGGLGATSYASGVQVRGSFAYLAAGIDGLLVIDVSSPTNLFLVGTGRTGGCAYDVKLSGNHAYVADGAEGVSVFDISAPAQPLLVGQFRTSDSAKGIRMDGNLVHVAVNSAGLVMLESTLPVFEPPQILLDPASQTAAAGNLLTLRVTASGSPPLCYQWSKNGLPLDGATNVAFTILSAIISDSGAYTVTVTNAHGSVVSSDALLTVVDLGPNFADDFEPGLDAPQWSEVSGTVRVPGLTNVFGSNALWFGHDGQRSATTRRLNTMNSGTISFSLLLTNGDCGWGPHTLPDEAVVVEASLDDGATWANVWIGAQVPLQTWTNVVVPISLVAQGPSARFRWRQLSHSCDCCDAWALDDVQILPQTTPSAPVIVEQPADQLVVLGQPASLSVGVRGTVPMFFQWRLQGTNLPGAGTRILSIPAVNPAQCGYYSVVVSNNHGAVTSTVAQLVMGNPGYLAGLPNVTLSRRGSVRAVARQEDGKVIIGGSFSGVNGVPRQNLARLNADGSLDAGWNPGVGDSVNALLVSGSQVYVGGFFSYIARQRLDYLARVNLNDSGSADTTWKPQPNGVVVALALCDTNLFASGYFTSIGGQSRSNLAKLSINNQGQADAVWAPNPDRPVDTMVARDRAVYAGGYFTKIGGQNRNRLAKFSTDGTGEVDALWDPNPNNAVVVLALDGTNLYAGGHFNVIGGRSRKYLARLDADGTGAADAVWNPNPYSSVFAVAVSGASVFSAGGWFPPINGQAMNGLVKLSANGTGTVDVAWSSGLDGYVQSLALSGTTLFVGGTFLWTNGVTASSAVAVDTASGLPQGTAPLVTDAPWGIYALARQDDGKTIVGGNFDLAGDRLRLNLARFNADGTLDENWNPSPNSSVLALAISGADILVGGSFSVVSGQSRSCLAKLSSSGGGAADANWRPNPNGGVYSLVVSGSDVFAAGSFTSVGGQSRNFLAKLGAAGTALVDPAWNPNASSSVSAMTLMGTNLYAGGSFTTIGGQPRNRVAKLSTEGSGAADALWNPNANQPLLALACDATGVYAGGNFSSIGGQARSYLAKLEADGIGAAVTNWAPNPNSAVSTIAVDSGFLYVGGYFSSIAGQTRAYLARLTDAGTADPIWKPALNNSVNVLAVVREGLCIGGAFTAVNGYSRGRFAMLSTEPAAPWIVVQPPSQSAPLGGSATFSVIANGTERLGYQWRFNGTNLTGATNNSLRVLGVQSDNAGPYSVIVTNAAGTVTSEVATLTVWGIPTIAVQPQSRTNIAGTTADFSVTATGNPTPSYQWRFNGTNLPGATGSSLSVLSVQPDNAGPYIVTVSNAAGVVTSAVATLTVWVAPMITAQPQGRTNIAGSTATFSVAATGDPIPSYQWRFNGTNLSGQTSATLAWTNVQTNDVGPYTVVVTNVAGSVTSAVATLTVVAAPVIAVQPPSRTNVAGSSLMFSVTAAGVGPLEYQWHHDAVAIPQATNRTHVLAGVTTNDAGRYCVVVSNSLGAVVSSNAYLTVYPLVPPGVLAGPVTNFANGHLYWLLAQSTWVEAEVSAQALGGHLATVRDAGEQAWIYSTFSQLQGQQRNLSIGLYDADPLINAATPLERHAEFVWASGEPVTYAKWGDGEPNNWQEAGEFYVHMISPDSLGRAGYWNDVRDANFETFTAVAPLNGVAEVAPAPVIVWQPQSQAVLAGGMAELRVKAVGALPLSYQWCKDGDGILGEKTDTLTLSNLTASDAGGYTVVVTNLLGAITSAPPAVLTVLFTVSVSASPSDGGSVTGGGSFAAATDVTVRATPTNGFTFTKWMEGESVESTFASYTFMLNGGRSLIAHFAPTPPRQQLTEVGLSNGAIRFVLNGPVGSNYVIEASSNLVHWLPLVTNVIPAGGSVPIADSVIGWATRFYRAVFTLNLPANPNPTRLVWVAPGTFTMGSPDSEPARDLDESPQTHVTLSQGFWMGKYEVTQGEYLSLMGNNPSGFLGDTNRPVERVSWTDATNYCANLTRRERSAGRLPTGYEYRLPTEAQWEYACRAGTTTAFYCGNELRSGMANFNGMYEYPPCGTDLNFCYNSSGTSLGRTASVGGYAPNAWGLFDMHGNVWEWCQDWYGPYRGGILSDPKGPAAGLYKMVRGGTWTDPAHLCRSAYHGGYTTPDSRDFAIGFRVVLAPE